MIYTLIVSNKLQNIDKIIIKYPNNEFYILYNTRDICMIYRNNRILKKYKRKEKTLGELRNSLLRYTIKKIKKEDYILWLDDDDDLSNDFYLIANRYIDSGFDVLFNESRIGFHDGKFSYEYKYKSPSFLAYKNEYSIVPYCTGILYRMSLLKNKKISFAKTDYSEEVPYFYYTLKYANKIGTMKGTHYMYYKNRYSVTSNSLDNISYRLSQMIKALRIVDDPDLYIGAIENQINYFSKIKKETMND